MNNRAIFLVTLAMTLSLSSVQAQEPAKPPAEAESEKESPPTDHSKMDHGKAADDETDHSKMDHGKAADDETDHSKMDHGEPADDETDHSKMDHGEAADSEMDHSKMDHGSAAAGPAMRAMDQTGGKVQGGSPPPDARDPHAYSGGYDFGEMSPLVLADRHNFKSLLADRVESTTTDGGTSATYDLQAWFGRDYDRAVLKAEGDFDAGNLEEAQTELLWGHAVAAYWGSQLGVRYDSGEGPDRTWLAFGIQGLAPYWFEVDATGYVGDAGRTAFNLEADYDLLLTQKLILQPRIEVDWYGKSDAARGIGSGLSEAVAGLRLRYEFRREFAPYLGVEWARKFGETKDLVRAAGADPSETRFVAGVRFWF